VSRCLTIRKRSHWHMSHQFVLKSMDHVWHPTVRRHQTVQVSLCNRSWLSAHSWCVFVTRKSEKLLLGRYMIVICFYKMAHSRKFIPVKCKNFVNFSIRESFFLQSMVFLYKNVLNSERLTNKIC